VERVCPVCKQPVVINRLLSTEFEHVTYFFRCPYCKERFDADPTFFLAPDGRAIVRLEAGLPKRYRGEP